MKSLNFRKRKKPGVIFFLMAITLLTACEVDIQDPPNHNEMNATIVRSGGAAINFTATGSTAEMGNSWLFGTYLKGTNASNASISIMVYDTTRAAYGVSSPGTYRFDCTYDPAAGGTVYTHTYSSPGTIIFTVSNNNTVEGSFSTVCRSATDSVTISGAFKGDRLK